MEGEADVQVDPISSRRAVVTAAFRQATAKPEAGAAGSAPAGGADAEDQDTQAIRFLKQQLAAAQAKLDADLRARADERTVQGDRQRVQLAASALAYAEEKWLAEQQKGERAARAARSAGQYA